MERGSELAHGYHRFAVRCPFWTLDSGLPKQAELHVMAAVADPDEEASEADRRARIAAALGYRKRVEAAMQTDQERCD